MAQTTFSKNMSVLLYQKRHIKSTFFKSVARSYIQHDISSLMTIISLYKNNVINRKKYVSMLRNMFTLNTDKIGQYSLTFNKLWFKKCYHCSITNEWFNYINIHEYFNELESSASIKPSDIELMDLYNAIKIACNEAKDIIIFTILRNILTHLIDVLSRISYYSIHEFCESVIYPVFLVKERIIDYSHFTPYGYCCEDCDGNYSTYCESQYKHQYILKIDKEARNVLCFDK